MERKIKRTPMERWKDKREDKREDKRTPIIRKKDSHFFPVEKFMGVLFFSVLFVLFFLVKKR